MASEYLHWAKMHSKAKYNLASSGILGYPLSGLPATIADLEINGPDVYGYEPLLSRLAKKCGVKPENIVTANGTSMANHLAMAAVIEPGDEVLIERPTYGLLLEVASYLHADIRRFERRAENNFQIDIEEVRSKITGKTRLIVLTNLHNPSGALTDEPTLRQIGELAAAAGARVLVDEVYLDEVYDMGATSGSFDAPRSSFQLGNHFLVTTSLTKAYGLSGLRCGWILAEPKLAERIWRLNDLFGAVHPYMAELLSVIALDNLATVEARAHKILEANHASLRSILAGNPALEFQPPRWGTVVFPRLRQGSVQEFAARLRAEYETAVVPGQYFELPDHFRVGLGGDPEMTAKGMEQLRKALG
jgi:aspartate/methionine/tyrosine aminotransferase